MLRKLWTLAKPKKPWTPRTLGKLMKPRKLTTTRKLRAMGKLKKLRMQRKLRALRKLRAPRSMELLFRSTTDSDFGIVMMELHFSLRSDSSFKTTRKRLLVKY